MKGIPDGSNPLEIGIGPGPGSIVVEDPLIDEPRPRIGWPMEALDELAGFELARVEEVESGLEVEAMLVVVRVLDQHVDNHSIPLDRLRARG